MSCRCVTVFGGSGFLGRQIVRHLQDADFAVRIASRHRDCGRSLFSRDVSGIEPFRADVNDDGSVASAVSGAWAGTRSRVGQDVELDQMLLQTRQAPLWRPHQVMHRRVGRAHLGKHLFSRHAAVHQPDAARLAVSSFDLLEKALSNIG